MGVTRDELDSYGTRFEAAIFRRAGDDWPSGFQLHVGVLPVPNPECDFYYKLFVIQDGEHPQPLKLDVYSQILNWILTEAVEGLAVHFTKEPSLQVRVRGMPLKFKKYGPCTCDILDYWARPDLLKVGFGEVIPEIDCRLLLDSEAIDDQVGSYLSRWPCFETLRAPEQSDVFRPRFSQRVARWLRR